MAAFNGINLRAFLQHLQEDEDFLESQIKAADAQVKGVAAMLNAMRERLENVRQLIAEIDGML